MIPVKKALRFGWAAAFGMLLLTGCSGSDRDAKTATSALINENKNIVAFGHISVQQLLDKLDYKNLPKANAIIGGELKSWESGIDLSKPIYFAVKAPFGHDAAPELTYVLMDVKNKDSLIGKFSQMGYTAEKSGDIECFREGDVAVGVRNELAIVLIKGGDFDYKTLLAETFKATEGSESDGKTQDILETSADLVAGVSIERMYTSSNTQLNNLDENKKKEIQEMVADGYVKTVVNFEKGQLTVKTTNDFSDKLKSMLFFKKDPSASIIQKLGSGNAWMGVSSNIDMRKMETFMHTYAPEAETKMNEQMPGGASLALAMVGENPLGKLFSGQFGLVMVGNPKSAEGMVPQFNMYLGLGSQGDFIVEKMKGYATLMQLKQEGDMFITESFGNTGAMAIAPRKDGIYAYTVSSSASGKLNIPAFAHEFGKPTFSAFVDFSQIDVKSLELRNGMEVLEIMSSLMITADENGGEMVLKTKDNSSNILKQMGLYYTKMLEERMGGMSL